MYSFSAFDIYDYLILIGLVIIALIVLFFLLNRIRVNYPRIENIYPRNYTISIILGILIIIISIIGYILLERSHTGIFKELSAATSRPYVLILVIGLLLGAILLTIGVYKRNLLKQSLK